MGSDKSPLDLAEKVREACASVCDVRADEFAEYADSGSEADRYAEQACTGDLHRIRALDLRHIVAEWEAEQPTERAVYLGLAAEVRRLRSLPVLPTCGQCGSCIGPAIRGGKPSFCDRDEVGMREIDPDSPPPSWCPLRGGGR